MSRMVRSTGKRPAGHQWTASEIRDMSDDDFLANEEAITAAMEDGRISRPSPGPNPRSVS